MRPNPIVELSKNLMLDSLANPSELTLPKKSRTTRKLGVKRPSPRASTLKKPDLARKTTGASQLKTSTLGGHVGTLPELDEARADVVSQSEEDDG